MIEQTVILVGGALTIFLLSSPKTAWWGHLLGIFVEPFWFYAAFKASQWGVGILCAGYTLCYIRGVIKFYKGKNHAKN